jgi:hypothetical protein
VPYCWWSKGLRMCKAAIGPVQPDPDDEDSEFIFIGNVVVPDAVIRRAILVPEGQRAFVFAAKSYATS